MKHREALISSSRVCEPKSASIRDSSSFATRGKRNKQNEDCAKPFSPFGETLSMSKWCANLVKLVFRSRTSFAAFARSSIHLPRDPQVSTSPVFPIPLPCIGVFDRMPSGLSSSQRAKRYFRQALVLVILALNFWWSGNCFVDAELLRRTPSRQQEAVIRRVVAFMQADGPRVPFVVTSVGRRVPKLIARLSELSELLTSVGPASNPYEKAFEGRDTIVPTDNSAAEVLEPYRNLDATRLKIVGDAHWDPTPYLSDDLVMAFRNPDALLFQRSDSAVVPKITDAIPEVVALAKLWDSRGLLVVHEHDIPSLYPEEQVRVFNCYKDVASDRQIGDRRGRNAWERRVAGPSKVLPAGCDLCEFDFDPSTHRISLSITDRRDFYHQFRVPFVRSLSNTLGPAIPREMLISTRAYDDWLSRRSVSKDRITLGDQLNLAGRFPKPQKALPSHLFVAFGSILQGDHGGVEFACDSHQNLLQSVGLLHSASKVSGNCPFKGIDFMDGLVIDDYFALSAFPKSSQSPSPDVGAFDKAQAVYSQHSLLGSPSKDIRGSQHEKIIGASVNSSPRAFEYGICPLGSPGPKRYALSWISMQVCSLSHTTDVLHLCLLGGWVSCLGFRRPMMSILNASFQLVNASEVEPDKPRLLPLPRSVAGELLLLALLFPLAASDLCAPFHSEVFSTDASITTGAICSAPVSVDFARVLWRTSRSKGAYHRLLTPTEALSKNLGVLEELPDHLHFSPDRPLAFHYDFIEIFSGAGVVTEKVAALGYVVGPPVDLSLSAEYDMSFPHVLSWLSFMVSSGCLLSFIVEPPCTTFSIVRRPALRSRLCPFGFEPHELQTENGNLLASRAIQLMHVGYINQTTGLLETPFSSLLKHLPSFRDLEKEEGVEQCRTDSCMFGSIHKKSFRFLAVHADLQPLRVTCDSSHSHVPVQGAYTKKSATYTPLLAARLAEVLSHGIDSKKAFLRGLDSLKVKGLESQLVNAVVNRASWKVDAAWDFKKLSHINILEFSVLERLAKKLAKCGQNGRFTCMVDSHVVAAASAKGRTSSVGLAPVLRRFCALSVACGLYFSVPYVPTRLNVADDPTRSVPLRAPSGCLDVFDWSSDDLYALASLPKLRRWSSNWARLVISILGSSVLLISDRAVFRHRFPICGCLAARPPPSSCLDFDSTLGFPGEGPVSRCPSSGFCGLSLKLSRGITCCTVGLVRSFPRCLVFAMVICNSAHGVGPRNSADMSRQVRRNALPLADGRPVLPTTTLNREVLFSAFSEWCGSQNVDLEHLLSSSLQNAEEINAILSHYGRKLYHAGRPYGHFAETINSLVSYKAILRRQLQPAWDVAYAWMRNEPPTHHTACPWQVFLSLLATALMWGWTREAGILALSFAGILRAGEGLKAVRGDLVLPEDSLFMNSFALLAIEESKTRFTVARHQCAKVDASDMVKVLQLAFKHLLPTERLWPLSSQTFRNRFKSLLHAVGLPSQTVNGCRPLDVGSLRPGGATWLLQVTENAELVRRRGRWTTTRVLEVYLQETACIRFWTGLNNQQRENIMMLATNFPSILAKCESLVDASIPTSCWYKLFCWS